MTPESLQEMGAARDAVIAAARYDDFTLISWARNVKGGFTVTIAVKGVQRGKYGDYMETHT